ncbi:MAG: Zn-dependent hydrolase of the metallo-beta-lactamase superfamily [Parcubacteria group bacterium GW2011_GWC1_42_11]|uniref:Zn-dependent hydrolase of the metallo-beta-lactamase superfamily n=1 Tax=Candidatus Nomurabacteria bacterium GW2011_GWC2_42_20 TaxID=1618756 RepID=A0A0G1CFM0_9BACT|nr:MAG: Zn-dependent hydrolase of the metallo-beta-lactamase superfamily [Parcubacteria group bacterium GW2011_GWC1_42_11]KKS48378.1 MAG: Zn-dependent hydrolase of the metallo-beta-lactamase superfamily [Candidatus Nomurabacteria bacterium GW2011_GWC2_42_20]KKS58803.1 MAG: Zn-dependent hydrolase of the metallo-beta-lactamase superfamily [Candidatus Nomurabacteria bacterium GW2011_GWA2_42_41]KKT09954.1 MAG: Zn-dependent hydrolase of the metallo-beta-lactamase superfamily [Candidatus Nomurabacteri
MIVTYYGKQFFKVQLGERTIAYNPIGKDSKEKGSRFGADIVLSSLRHPDFNGADQCAYGDRQPFVISGPGEYEVGGIFIKGFGTETKYSNEKKINTVFSVMFEGINLCFLGSLASPDSLSREVKEGLGEIDVLFAPIGSGEELSAADAYKLTLALEAKVVIPMDYEQTKGSLEAFIKESGENAETMEKFTFKRKDLEGKEGGVVVLKSA